MELVIDEVGKRYGDAWALRNFSLELGVLTTHLGDG